MFNRRELYEAVGVSDRAAHPREDIQRARAWDLFERLCKRLRVTEALKDCEVKSASGIPTMFGEEDKIEQGII
jgi:hypothetical protein